ncbi:MAG: orotidine-5'-phosphate decarboxylase [Clostridia bacterium]|nr:orotidine-5'-phosphate decarboxylase [Clostridia bacterium]
MGKGVIIACDFKDKADTLAFLDNFKDEKLFLKIGMELFYSEGPDIVREIKNRGHKIFLDLKLHDIPNTVEKGMKSLSRLDVDMTNVHAAGTKDMMAAGLKGLTKEDGTRNTILIGVTQLTSTSQERMENELLIKEPIEDVVMHYAKNTQEAGLDGVVCSPLEVQAVKAKCGKDFITVTPGIRFAAKDAGDQVRITTPAKAKELGSDYIVVGRPITQAEDPVEAYRKCVEDFID